MANKKKENKRVNKKENREFKSSFDESILNKLIIVLCIICFLGLFYLLTIYITGKNDNDNNDDKSKKEEKEEVSIAYDEIILGRSLSMSDDNYLVLCYDKSNEDLLSTYEKLISTYKDKEGSLVLYTVDMSTSFNSAYTTDKESNKYPKSVQDFAINGPTLFRVTDKQVNEYIEGEEAISNYLN